MATAKKSSAKSEDGLVTEYILSKKKAACKIIDRIMKEFKNEERIQSAPLNQLSSVMGTLLDKFGADEKEKASDGQLAEIFGDFEEVR